MCPGMLSLSALLRGPCLFGIELRIHISLRKQCELYGVWCVLRGITRCCCKGSSF